MGLFIVFITLCVCIFIDDHPSKKERMKQMPHGCNIGIQYMYTIDEWYKLRCEFDKKIEGRWKLYKDGLISENDYKNDCLKVVEEMIGYDYIEEFTSLYQWGVRNAAIRTAREGYNPGLSTAGRTLSQLNCWEPERYGIYLDYWHLCVPGDANFLTMYPDKWELEYMSLGHIKRNKWTAEPFVKYEGYPMFTGYFDEDARRTVHDLLVSRGYDGETYTNEAQRDFGDLTDEDIKMKYKYVLNSKESNYRFAENSAHCDSGSRKKYVYNR